MQQLTSPPGAEIEAKIRAIIDSNNEVRESSERNNVTPWLEVQLPHIEIRRPPAEMKPKETR